MFVDLLQKGLFTFLQITFQDFILTSAVTGPFPHTRHEAGGKRDRNIADE